MRPRHWYARTSSRLAPSCFAELDRLLRPLDPPLRAPPRLHGLRAPPCARRCRRARGRAGASRGAQARDAERSCIALGATELEVDVPDQAVCGCRLPRLACLLELARRLLEDASRLLELCWQAVPLRRASERLTVLLRGPGGSSSSARRYEQPPRRHGRGRAPDRPRARGSAPLTASSSDAGSSPAARAIASASLVVMSDQLGLVGDALAGDTSRSIAQRRCAWWLAVARGIWP